MDYIIYFLPLPMKLNFLSSLFKPESYPDGTVKHIYVWSEKMIL